MTLRFLLALAVIWGPPATAQVTVVRAGRLVDVERGTTRVNQEILVEGQRIVTVRPSGQPLPAHASVIDLSAYTVLPGLIDLHTHLVGDLQSSDPLAPLRTTRDQDMAGGIRNARATLTAGFTTVRDVGSYRAFVDVALRDTINRYGIPGPRMAVAGPYVTARGGGGEVTGDTTVNIPPEMRAGVANGAAEVRRRVGEILDGGADFIKIIATGAVLTPGTDPGNPEYSEDEIRAAVEEARARGTYVAAHAHGAEGIRRAVRAGVRSIEHGSLMDAEGIALMKDGGTWLVADIFNGDYIATEGRRAGWPEDILQKNDATTGAQREVFRRAVRAGVRIAYGTDSGVYPHGLATAQLPYMVRYGLTPMQAVQSATISAARVMGWEDRVGSIAPGKFADIIAVPGNLLDTLQARVQAPEGTWSALGIPFVMKGGEVVKQPGARAGRALTTDDYSRLRGLQDIQAAPTGRMALLKIGTVDTLKDEYTSDLWIIDPASGNLRQLTFSEGTESHPRFSPDGRRVAFIAASGEVRVIPAGGGPSSRLFSFGEAVEEFEWFPDGDYIAFTAKVPEPEDSARVRAQVRQYDRTLYKVNGIGFLDNRPVHLWVADLRAGTVRRISGGPYDHAAPAVSPDGRWVAFVSNRTPDRDENRNSDVFAVPADSGSLVQVSHEAGSADQPRWSPDGGMLAYLEQVVPNNYGAHSYLWVTPVRSVGSVPSFGEPLNLTADMDRHVAEGSYTEGGSPYPRWSPDGGRLYVAIEDRARVHAYAIDPATGVRQLVLGGDRSVEFLTPVAGGLLLGIAGAAHLSDVFALDEGVSPPRQLTRLNDAWFRDVRVLPMERLSIRAPDGAEVEAFVVKPPDFQPGRKYPAILGIHGGPQWYYSSSYHMQFQIAASRGYLAVYINPRGSTTYGHDFMALVGGRYGHADDQDFMAALDTVVSRGWADPDNLFLMGNSYGGIATNWLVTQTGRFRAAASSSGVADYTASFGVDDDHIEWIADMGGAPWQVPERYRRESPMTWVERVTTPTIFLHGAEDHICPVGESERMYLALALRGIPTRLVIFPGENHNFDAQASSYPLRSRLVLEWFDAHRRR